jgi:hypothetical protein
MKKNTQDLLIMLLSTDWFAGYWNVVGLNLSKKQEQGIRNGCRSMIEELMSDGKDYYNSASMTTKRMLATRAKLISLFDQNQIAKSAIDAVENILNISFESECNAQNIDSLNVALHARKEDLVATIDEYLLTAVVGASDKWSHEPDCLPYLLSREARASSPWDLYIKKIHPETSLSHLASAAQLLRKNSCIWSELQNTLTPSQIQSLLSFYRNIIPTITPPNEFTAMPTPNCATPDDKEWISIEFDSTRGLWVAKDVAAATDVRELVIKLSQLGYVANGDDHMLWTLRDL